MNTLVYFVLVSFIQIYAYKLDFQGEDYPDEDDPETVPDLFQGDIAMKKDEMAMLKIGINPMKFPQKLWENRTVPFTINREYSFDERALIDRSLTTLASLTCLNFRQYSPDSDKNFIHFKPPEGKSGGCWSFVGKTGGEQVITLQKADKQSAHCFSSEGRVIHEILHSVGIYHEQSRPDRDKFIKIHSENIIPKYKKNFKLITSKGKHSFEYDYNSVMHYGFFYFSKEKGKKPTITPTKPKIRIGQRRTISKIDCLKINELYGCLRGREARKYRSFCSLLAL